MSRRVVAFKSNYNQIEIGGTHTHTLDFLSLVLIRYVALQNSDLLIEARKVKLYRDEIDVLREKADRVDKLEGEVQRFNERIIEVNFYKSRNDEILEENRTLLHNRDALEAEILLNQQRGNRILQLETELLSYKQRVNDLSLVR